MQIIDYLKNKITARRADHATTYWRGLEKAAAADSMSERAMAALFDAIEGTLPAMGKTIEDFEHDLDAMREFAAVQDAPAQRDAAHAEAAALVQDGAKMLRRADELEAEARRLRETADGKNQQARAVKMTAEQIMQEFEALSSKLAAAGHPQFAARAANAAKQREVESLRGELVSLDAGMNASHEAPSTRRASIRTRLAELGVPLDDNDNAMDEPLPEEVGRG